MTLSIIRFAVLMIALLLTRAPGLAAEPTDGAGTAGPADHAGHGGHAACPFAAAPGAELPDQVGQDAFAALAEMRDLLAEDPATDWSRVDLDAFREHLVDMHRVVIDADVAVRPVVGGFEARVTGTGRTLEAIRRLIPAHARFVDDQGGLRAIVSNTAEAGHTQPGVVVTVTTVEAPAVARLRSLGFFGFLVAGDHHRPHHLAMALGAGHP